MDIRESLSVIYSTPIMIVFFNIAVIFYIQFTVVDCNKKDFARTSRCIVLDEMTKRDLRQKLYCIMYIRIL